MNPAALKTNIKDLPKGGTLILDADAFTERNLQKAGYAENPLEDGSLDEFQLHKVPLTTLTVGALKDIDGVTPREAERSKNMFALGLMSWLYGRPVDATIEFLQDKFGEAPRDRRRRTSGAAGRLCVRRDDGVVRGHVRGEARGDGAGRSIATSPATRRCRTG